MRKKVVEIELERRKFVPKPLIYYEVKTVINQYVIDGGITWIHLNDTCKVMIDTEDLELVSKVRSWWLSEGYAMGRDKGGTIGMHRLINNTPKGLVTDHIDDDKLNNRRHNLCSTTYRGNADKNTNKGIQKTKSGRYRVRVGIGGYGIKHIGVFGTKEEAIQAREDFLYDTEKN